MGNAADLTLPATGTDGLAATHIVIDTTPPAVTAVSSTQSAGVYGAGTTIPITVTFGEAVNVTGTPQLTLNDGASGRLRQRQRHDDAHLQLYCRGGREHAATGLCLDRRADAQRRHHPGRDRQRRHAHPLAPGTGIDGLAAQNIVIDTTPRTVTAVSTSKPSGTYGPGTSIPITVTFGEPMTVTSPVLLLLNASTARSPTMSAAAAPTR